VQGDDASAVETRVIQLLGLDHFDLAKDLLRNRLKIVWVSKLRQAQDETEVRSFSAAQWDASCGRDISYWQRWGAGQAVLSAYKIGPLPQHSY
jgi:hypothetical protein